MKRVLQALVFLALVGVFVALIGWRGTLLLAGVCYLGAQAAESRKRRTGRLRHGSPRVRPPLEPPPAAAKPLPPIRLLELTPEEEANRARRERESREARARWAEIDRWRQKMRDEIASRQKSSDGSGPTP